MIATALASFVRQLPAHRELILNGVACGAGSASLVACWVGARRIRRRADREAKRLDEAISSCRKAFEEKVASLSRDVESFQANMQSTEDLLRDGRLNVSGRAHALQMLRAGISPDAAAVTLGTGAREMRLLAKISSLLAIR